MDLESSKDCIRLEIKKSGRQYIHLVSSHQMKEEMSSRTYAWQHKRVYTFQTQRLTDCFVRLVFKDQTPGLLMCGGRIQTFREDHRAVPLLPFQAWISTLLAREAHSEGHDGLAGTLLRMRRERG